MGARESLGFEIHGITPFGGSLIAFPDFKYLCHSSALMLLVFFILMKSMYIIFPSQ
jgi:hypothetical protein